MRALSLIHIWIELETQVQRVPGHGRNLQKAPVELLVMGLKARRLLGEDDQMFALAPVSYTHLDVYKRQL